MKEKMSVSIDKERIRQIEKVLEKGFFRNKSHVLEFALIKFFESREEDFGK